MSAFAPWQQRVLDGALSALAQGQLGHALLVCGPPALGKGAVARALAARLLCTSPGSDRLACGRCRSCQLFAAGTHPDLLQVSYEENEKTGKLRSEIVVDQIRDLARWFTLTPQLGGAQVAVIEPAEALNGAAANALLKTLEEPARDRYLLLVTDRPARLMATLRSRCQRLEFRPPPADEARAWLAAAGHAEPALSQALEAARGHPGLAAQWLAGGGLALRAQVREMLDRVGAGKASPLETAQAWLADDQAALRLRFAADLAVDGLAARLAGRAGPGLSLPADTGAVPAWFEGINRAREQLTVPALRHDLALAGLLLEWRKLMGNQGKGATR